MYYLKTMAVSGTEDYTTDYAYDLNNRLKTETKDKGLQTETAEYQYDKNGNQISKTTFTTGNSGGAEEVGIYELGSKLPMPREDYTVEINEYDVFNRLVKVQNDEGTSLYRYKSDGLRLSKNVNGALTTHIWDGQNIVLEFGAVNDVYLRGINLIKSDEQGFYLYNAHGDIVQRTNSSGGIIKSYVYDTFGVEAEIDEMDSNPFRYCAEYYDAETGSIYLRARYYDPSVGGFMSEDPIRDGLNWYTYCMGNPVVFVDPTGLLTLEQYPSFIQQFTGAAVSTTWDNISGTNIFNFGEKLQEGISSAQGIIDMGVSLYNQEITVGDIASAVGEGVWDGISGDLRFIIDNHGWFDISKELSDWQVTELAERSVGAWEETAALAMTITGIVQSARNLAATRTACFIAGTEISAEGGHKPIEEINVGDMVYSQNVETGEVGLKRVAQVFVRETDRLVHLDVDGQSITTTPEHPFYVPQKGWVTAEELVVGEKLLLQSGEIVDIDQVQHEIPKEPITVYNFEVEDWHTYFVSDHSILVHNTCGVDHIQHSTYNDMRNKIGKTGADKFIDAMKQGSVGSKGASGVKALSGKGVKIGGTLYQYEVKLYGELANYRLYGNFSKEAGHIVFTHFGKALH